MDLWLIRHAESTWNAAGRWQGQGDPPLSARGGAQARELAARLVHAELTALRTSDLRRAAGTARLLGERLGLLPASDARLRERDLGSWTGLTGAAIASRWPAQLARLRRGDPALRPGGGERLADVRARVAALLDELATRPPGRRVAIVTHLGVIRLLTGEEPENAGWCRASLSACRAALTPTSRPTSARPACG